MDGPKVRRHPEESVEELFTPTVTLHGVRELPHEPFEGDGNVEGTLVLPDRPVPKTAVAVDVIHKGKAAFDVEHSATQLWRHLMALT